ncbi:MAG: hypothetical protein ABI746_13460 [Dermatophilaceae bacterium]
MTPLLASLGETDRADLATFAGRAEALEREGVLRWQSGHGLLVTTVRARAGQGLLRRGEVLGLRAVAADGVADADLVVSLAALRDALASDGPLTPVPPSHGSASWVGLAPPRGGWEQHGVITMPAGEGTSVAGAVAAAAGEWLDEMTSRDAASALQALGFLPPWTEGVRLFRRGAWTRMSTSAGHVLIR